MDFQWNMDYVIVMSDSSEGQGQRGQRRGSASRSKEGSETDIDAPASQVTDGDGSEVSLPRRPERKVEKKMEGETRTCKMCKKNPVEPKFHFCLPCFKKRRSWLPPRPPSRSLKKRKAEERRAATGTGRRRRRATINLRQLAMSRGIRLSPPPASQAMRISEETTLTLSLNASIEVGRASQDLNEGFLEAEEDGSVPNASEQEGTSRQQGGPSPNSLQNNSEGVSVSNPEERIVRTSSSVPEVENPNPRPTPQSLSTQGSAGVEDMNTRSAISEPDQPLCMFCCNNPKDSAFVHNGTAHLASCFYCGDRILRKTGRCPICREPILRLVRVVMY